MNNRYLRFIHACVLCLDILSLNASVVFCHLLLHVVDTDTSLEYTRFWIWLNLSWLFIVWITNLSSTINSWSFETLSRRAMQCYGYWLALLMLYLYFTHQFALSRLFIACVVTLYGTLVFINRLLFLFIRAYFKQHHFFIRKIMIIGYNDIAKKLAFYLEQDGMNAEIVGFCEEERNVHELSNYPIVDSITNSIIASRHYHVNEVYSTIAPEHNLQIYELMQEADQACIHFRIIPDLSYFVKRTVYINYLKDIPVLSLRHEPLDDAGNRIKKRVFDVVFSLLVTIFILSWLIPILGFLIWMGSPGPVFFKQKRTGRNKEVFTCLKFRSMVVNGNAHYTQATVNDNRFTRLGKFMRRTNLDEFPQFLNVLKGDMSIVGPRPHMLKHTDDYSMLIDKYMIRQFLKPGITGWAQVHGLRGEIKTIEQMQNRVEFDIWYMENWSLWLDVRIIFLTIFNMLLGKKNGF